MKIRLSWFNSYLLLLALALGTGCKSAGRRHQDKLAATFRLHLEATPHGSESTAVIQIAGAEDSGAAHHSGYEFGLSAPSRSTERRHADKETSRTTARTKKKMAFSPIHVARTLISMFTRKT